MNPFRTHWRFFAKRRIARLDIARKFRFCRPLIRNLVHAALSQEIAAVPGVLLAGDEALAFGPPHFLSCVTVRPTANSLSPIASGSFGFLIYDRFRQLGENLIGPFFFVESGVQKCHCF